ncbi:hypothetical protein [Cupriavidus basilensis]|uniref:hypothetical protein n=1 Tax=Cupriavidus basilensis TaxID=68895 RepID=UPI001ED92280|nr:hypothetical protein [Cupriavidus basilensis]
MKNPIISQVQKGTVKLGYTSTSDHSESCRPSAPMMREKGMNRMVGGILPPAAACQPGQAVAGRHRQQQGDDHHHRPHQQRIGDPAQVPCLQEQHTQVVQGGRLVEQEGIVGCVDQVVDILEGGDQHPVEGKRAEPREDGKDGGMAEACAPARATALPVACIGTHVRLPPRGWRR